MGNDNGRNRAAVKALLERLKRQVRKGITNGLDAAGRYLTERVKETLNVPAPRKRVINHAGELTWRATTPATPGAAPRRVTGALRRGISTKVAYPNTITIVTNARSSKGFNYGKYHEVGGRGSKGGLHHFVSPTYKKYRADIRTILNKSIKASIQ